MVHSIILITINNTLSACDMQATLSLLLCAITQTLWQLVSCCQTNTSHDADGPKKSSHRKHLSEKSSCKPMNIFLSSQPQSTNWSHQTCQNLIYLVKMAIVICFFGEKNLIGFCLICIINLCYLQNAWSPWRAVCERSTLQAKFRPKIHNETRLNLQPHAICCIYSVLKKELQ